MEMIELTLALLLAVAAVGALANWVPLPLPILLFGAGLGLSYIPAFADLRIEPEVFFLLFIPPLLFGDGWLIPKREFVNLLRPILLLAFGLVFLTVIVVGYFMHWLIPSLPLAAAFALGAVVSPTDAVAVSSITEKLKIPSRATYILNGESLINDASGLVAFRFAVAAVATGSFSGSEATVQFVLLSAGGFLVGLAVAWLIGMMRLALVNFSVADPKILTVISLLTPYAAYLAAERLGVGGILAVVASALYAGSHDTRHLDAETRAHSWEVWRMVLFAFNGLVFLLLGLELHSLAQSVVEIGWATLGGYALALAAIVIALRLLWVYPAAYLPLLLSRRIREREGSYSPRAVFLIGWSGIRGAVTLAAALSLPYTTASGAPFPGRDLIIVLAASVIVISLLLNGLGLPFLIRALGIRGDGIAEREERSARMAIAQAAMHALREELPKLRLANEVAYAKGLIDEYERRVDETAAETGEESRVLGRRALQRLRLAAIQAERDELLHLRDTDVINEEVLRVVQSELDHAESVVRASNSRDAG